MDSMTIRKIKLGIVMVIILVTAGAATLATLFVQQQVEGGLFDFGHLRKAPLSILGDNVYIAWQSNNTVNGNEEIMFRASTDGGQTFGDKINLSNSPDTQSQTAEILAVGNIVVYVTWWELNENVHPHTNESVLRVSTDAGQTFGPVINLGSNGTITTGGGGNSSDFLSSRGGGSSVGSASGGDTEQ
jgi:hypothetical protein